MSTNNGASPPKPHKAGYSRRLKRKMEDRDDGEAYEEGLRTAKRLRVTQPVARSNPSLGSTQPKTSTEIQAIDEMDISNKGDELDSSLLGALKKMTIKPADEVKMDLDSAEQVLTDSTYLRRLATFQNLLSWILATIPHIQPSPMSAQGCSSCFTSF